MSFRHSPRQGGTWLHVTKVISHDAAKWETESGSRQSRAGPAAQKAEPSSLPALPSSGPQHSHYTSEPHGHLSSRKKRGRAKVKGFVLIESVFL